MSRNVLFDSNLAHITVEHFAICHAFVEFSRQVTTCVISSYKQWLPHQLFFFFLSFFAVIERVCHFNSVTVVFPLKRSTHGELIYFSVMPQGTKSGNYSHGSIEHKTYWPTFYMAVKGLYVKTQPVFFFLISCTIFTFISYCRTLLCDLANDHMVRSSSVSWNKVA